MTPEAPHEKDDQGGRVDARPVRVLSEGGAHRLVGEDLPDDAPARNRQRRGNQEERWIAVSLAGHTSKAARIHSGMAPMPVARPVRIPP